MSFGDELVREPSRPSHLLLRCRRCGALHSVETTDPERHVQELVANNRTTTTVRCDDGALAVAEVIGVGPGRPFKSATEAA